MYLNIMNADLLQAIKHYNAKKDSDLECVRISNVERLEAIKREIGIELTESQLERILSDITPTTDTYCYGIVEGVLYTN